MEIDAHQAEEAAPAAVARPWHARPLVRIAALCLVLLCVALGTSGTIDRRAVAAVLKDPLSIFAGRSPGARAPGAMTQTKPDRSRIILGRSAPPRERVLAGGRTRPADPIGDPAGTPGTTIVDGPIETAAAGPGGLFATDDVPPGGGVITDGGGFVIPPIGGPGGGGGGVILPTQPGDPAPAVPEPATWLTMMLGLGAIGAALRRRRARALVVAPRT